MFAMTHDVNRLVVEVFFSFSFFVTLQVNHLFFLLTFRKRSFLLDLSTKLLTSPCIPIPLHPLYTQSVKCQRTSAGGMFYSYTGNLQSTSVNRNGDTTVLYGAPTLLTTTSDRVPLAAPTEAYLTYIYSNPGNIRSGEIHSELLLTHLLTIQVRMSIL